jgi:hypothetical protein
MRGKWPQVIASIVGTFIWDRLMIAVFAPEVRRDLSQL